MEGNDVFFQTTSLPFIQHPTQRAADGGYVPRFRVGFWRETFPCRGLVQPLPTTANADRWAASCNKQLKKA